MYADIANLLAREGVSIVQTTSKVFGKVLKDKEGDCPFMHTEVSVNAKTAYELALAGAWASKRTACVIPTQDIYDALDPIMSSAYTGVAGGFIVLCLKEIEEEATPVGLFSKLPVIVAEGLDALSRAISFGYGISEKYEIPVMVQTPVVPGPGRIAATGACEPAAQATRTSQFVKDPNRWAATPKFRYELHRLLNGKVEKIREEFEAYEGNVVIRQEPTGIISYTRSTADYFDEEASMLCLSTVFPLPFKLVESFVAEMDEVFMAEPYPVIELQIRDRSKIMRGPNLGGRKKTKPEETMYGFAVIRDNLGPGSSINMAHGIRKMNPERKLLAVTFEDYFFDTGMPSFVNTIYNDSSFVVLILGATREDEMKRILASFGCNACEHIDDVSEIERFQDHKELTVLFYKGII